MRSSVSQMMSNRMIQWVTITELIHNWKMIHESLIDKSDYSSHKDSKNVNLSLHRPNFNSQPYIIMIMIHFAVGCDLIHLLFSIVGS